ncbi:universal stress protein [Myxococcota bacterium]|nr:universal stress protein [Myxococcota bacterium]
MSLPSRLLLATSLRGDPAAELERALPFARALGADVRVIHVVSDPVPLYSEYSATLGANVEAAVRDAIAEARGRVDALIAPFASRGVGIEGDVLRGDPRYLVVAEAKRWGATMVAVHPGEHDLAERLLLGTTSRYVLHHATVPVLLLRPSPAARGGLGEIVVPVEPDDPDFVPPQDVLGALALGLPGRLRFVSVLAEADLLRGLDREQGREAARNRLDAVLTRLRGPGHVDVERLGEVIWARRASDGVLEFAREHGAGLIAMRTHGRRAVSRALLGSVCDQVVSRAQCSVLAFPPTP